MNLPKRFTLIVPTYNRPDHPARLLLQMKSRYWATPVPLVQVKVTEVPTRVEPGAGLGRAALAVTVTVQARLSVNTLPEIVAPAQGHKGAVRISGRPGEAGVVGGEEALPHVAVGRGHGADPGRPKLVDEPILQGPVEPLTAAPGLGE